MKRTWVWTTMLFSWSLAGCSQCGVDSESQPGATAEGHETPASEPAKSGSAPSAAVRPADPPPAGKPNDRSPLGNNLAGITDWATAMPFIDAFKQSREFISGTPDKFMDDRPLALDAAGWVRKLAPGQQAKTMVFTESKHYEAGRYLLTYEGEGKRIYHGTAKLVPEASKPGVDVLDFDPARPGGMSLVIDSVNPDDPLRNLRLIRPGGACDLDRTRFCDDSQPCPKGECLSFAEHHEELVFHPDYLSSIQRYGMLRFMDWMQTNNSVVKTWEDRPRVEQQTWASKRGVPLEVMAQLANQLHAQPWFNIPHAATDDYVRNFAKLAGKLVDPELPIWVEYSNEVWNTLFEQHRYARAKGLEKGLSEDDFGAAVAFYGRRSLEVFRIFQEELGAERVVQVVATLSAVPDVAKQILAQPGITKYADAIAIAPYFGVLAEPGNPIVAKNDLDALVEHTREQLLPKTREHMKQHAEIAKDHGLMLVAYEGGQHFVGVQGGESDAQANRLFDALNRDPRMKELYLSYLGDWKAAGGQWFNHFVHCDKWSKWGRWGALEYIGQPVESSPKLQALWQFIDDNPRWW